MIEAWWGCYFWVPDVVIAVVVGLELIIVEVLVHVWLWCISLEKKEEYDIGNVYNE